MKWWIHFFPDPVLFCCSASASQRQKKHPLFVPKLDQSWARHASFRRSVRRSVGRRSIRWLRWFLRVSAHVNSFPSQSFASCFGSRAREAECNELFQTVAKSSLGCGLQNQTVGHSLSRWQFQAAKKRGGRAQKAQGAQASVHTLCTLLARPGCRVCSSQSELGSSTARTYTSRGRTLTRSWNLARNLARNALLLAQTGSLALNFVRTHSGARRRTFAARWPRRATDSLSDAFFGEGGAWNCNSFVWWAYLNTEGALWSDGEKEEWTKRKRARRTWVHHWESPGWSESGLPMKRASPNDGRLSRVAAITCACIFEKWEPLIQVIYKPFIKSIHASHGSNNWLPMEKERVTRTTNTHSERIPD